MGRVTMRQHQRKIDVTKALPRLLLLCQEQWWRISSPWGARWAGQLTQESMRERVVWKLKTNAPQLTELHSEQPGSPIFMWMVWISGKHIAKKWTHKTYLSGIPNTVGLLPVPETCSVKSTNFPLLRYVPVTTEGSRGNKWGLVLRLLGYAGRCEAEEWISFRWTWP
jgi:hypothetical protein